MLERKMFKMKRNMVKKILAVVLVASMSFGCTTSAYAGAKSANVRVKELYDGFVLKDKSGNLTMGKRSGKYAYGSAKLVSVTPCGSYTEDNFTRIRANVYKNENKKFSCIISGVSKSEGVVLTEGAKTYSKLRIKEGQLYVKYLYFGWSGNSPKYPAEASVKYNAN